MLDCANEWNVELYGFCPFTHLKNYESYPFHAIQLLKLLTTKKLWNDLKKTKKNLLYQCTESNRYFYKNEVLKSNFLFDLE